MLKSLGLGGGGPAGSALTENSNGDPALAIVPDGLAPSQKRVIASTYNSTDIFAVQVIVKGTGDLVLSPKSGDTDITITGAELTAMGINVYTVVFYGRYDSITAGTGMEVLAYIA